MQCSRVHSSAPLLVATRLLLATALSLGLSVLGCNEQPLTEADCIRVRDRIRAAWKRDAVAALRDANTDGFRRYVQDETRRIGERFMDTCRPRIGSPVAERELVCLQKVSTIDDVYECSR